jgi:NADPH-dependent ferric siderophore reductase
MGLIDRIARRILEQATIVHKSKLSEAAYHIRIQSDKMKDANFLPGYFLRLGVGFGADTSLKDKVRSYTVWDIDKSKGTIDCAIATHSNGVGTDWINKCDVGGKVSFVWHKGKFLVDDSADSYLFIGDLSTLAHLYMINRSLSQGKRINGIIYSESQDEFFADIDGSLPFQFFEMPQNPYEQILLKVKEIVPTMPGRKIVYIAGDSRVCLALNQYFRRKLNWDSQQIKTKPFWNPDKKGLE